MSPDKNGDKGKTLQVDGPAPAPEQTPPFDKAARDNGATGTRTDGAEVTAPTDQPTRANNWGGRLRAGHDWFKERIQNAANGAVEDIIKLAFVAIVAAVVVWLGWYSLGNLFGITPPPPPTFDENAAKNPDGPFHFMPMVDFSRDSLGMEVNWDPPLAKDSTVILYPKALSVQKLRGNVLKQFQEQYPHCIDMEWNTVKAADGRTDLREMVTLRLGKLEGPQTRHGDPRNYYFCGTDNRDGAP